MNAENENYSIRADESQNLLFVEFKNFLNDAVMVEAIDLLIREAKKLKPGFTVITDLLKYKTATSKGAEEIKRGQQFLTQHGVKRIFRVTNTDQITGKIQFDRLSRESYPRDVEIVNVGSLAEALARIKQ